MTTLLSAGGSVPCIASEDGMEVVGEASDGVEAVAMAQELEPDVILMDMVMPRQTGLEAIQEIQDADCPRPASWS